MPERVVLERDELWYVHLYCPICDQLLDSELDPQVLNWPIEPFFATMIRHNESVHPE